MAAVGKERVKLLSRFLLIWILLGNYSVFFFGCALHPVLLQEVGPGRKVYSSASPADLSGSIRSVSKVSQEDSHIKEALKKLHERRPELEELIERPYGMILVTGPTGCGKTTTLYTVLNKLNVPSRNIMTIEDPVEIRLPYLRQIQVHTEIGLSFASALRAIVRQDPDVILVGEIRDNETATIGLQAALTGHMVLSTLHTNDAPGAIARMRDYNLPAFVINSAVLGIVAQRLVRRLCQNCAVPDAVDDMMLHRFGLDAQDKKSFMRNVGCPRCGQTGYRGRVGLYELLKFTAPIQTLVEQGGSTKKIRERAIREGMRQMWHDGLEKARLGQTSLEEVAKMAAVVAVTDSTGDVRKSA